MLGSHSVPESVCEAPMITHVTSADGTWDSARKVLLGDFWSHNFDTAKHLRWWYTPYSISSISFKFFHIFTQDFWGFNHSKCFPFFSSWWLYKWNVTIQLVSKTKPCFGLRPILHQTKDLLKNSPIYRLCSLLDIPELVLLVLTWYSYMWDFHMNFLVALLLPTPWTWCMIWVYYLQTVYLKMIPQDRRIDSTNWRNMEKSRSKQ